MDVQALETRAAMRLNATQQQQQDQQRPSLHDANDAHATQRRTASGRKKRVRRNEKPSYCIRKVRLVPNHTVCVCRQPNVHRVRVREDSDRAAPYSLAHS